MVHGRAEPQALRSTVFRREREADWRALEELLARADEVGVERLDAASLRRLPSLYRAAASSLSVARSVSVDAALLRYLESLVLRGHRVLYGVRQAAGAGEDPRDSVRGWLTRGLPQTIRRRWRPLAVALGLLLGGVIAGHALYSPETYAAFVPASMAQGRTPTSSTASLRRVLGGRAEDDAGPHRDVDDEGGDGDDGETPLDLFASALFTNNAQVSLLAATLGFLLGLPTAFLLLFNGLVLGAMSGLYASRGLGLEFWLWVLPHGVTELTAVALAGAAGLTVAGALIAPGPYGRTYALSHQGREAAELLLGAGLMLLIAAFIEGFLRQLVSDPWARGALSTATVLFWASYFGLAGRGRGHGSARTKDEAEARSSHGAGGPRG